MNPTIIHENCELFHPIHHRFGGISSPEGSGWYRLEDEVTGWAKASQWATCIDTGTVIKSGNYGLERAIKCHYARRLFNVELDPSKSFEIWEGGVNYDNVVFNLINGRDKAIPTLRNEGLLLKDLIGEVESLKEEFLRKGSYLRPDQTSAEKSADVKLGLLESLRLAWGQGRVIQWRTSGGLWVDCENLVLGYPPETYRVLNEKRRGKVSEVRVRGHLDNKPETPAAQPDHPAAQPDHASELLSIINSINDGGLHKTCKVLLSNESFFNHPASLTKHHAYIGGLAVHTLEVYRFAIDFLKSFPPVANDRDRSLQYDILTTAVLWHDYAKIWDYKIGTWYRHQYPTMPKRYLLIEETTDYKKVYHGDYDYQDKIHHVNGSTAEFTAYAVQNGVGRDIIQRIQHAILSHHGRVEWGSTKIPQDLESWILHSADYASASFGGRKEK